MTELEPNAIEPEPEESPTPVVTDTFSDGRQFILIDGTLFVLAQLDPDDEL